MSWAGSALQLLKLLKDSVGSELVATATERAVTGALGVYGKSLITSRAVSMIEAASRSARFAGENYLSPQAGLHFIDELFQLAIELSLINPELAEAITEGISDDLMQALQHITTEPVERLYAVRFGAENLDSDDLTEAYAWGLMPPEMFAWLLAVSGVSNSAAAAAATKALGEMYSGTFAAVGDVASSAAGLLASVMVDSVERPYSEALSALYGVPEAARTAYNEYVSEVLNAYTRALHRAMEALVLYESAGRAPDQKTAQQLKIKAELKLAEAESWLDAAGKLQDYAHYYEEALEDAVTGLVAAAASRVAAARERLVDHALWRLGEAVRLAREAEDELWSEYTAIADAMQRIRDVNFPSPGAGAAGGGQGDEQVDEETLARKYPSTVIITNTA